jgi:hypothetical protein
MSNTIFSTEVGSLDTALTMLSKTNNERAVKKRLKSRGALHERKVKPVTLPKFSWDKEGES